MYRAVAQQSIDGKQSGGMVKGNFDSPLIEMRVTIYGRNQESPKGKGSRLMVDKLKSGSTLESILKEILTRCKKSDIRFGG